MTALTRSPYENDREGWHVNFRVEVRDVGARLQDAYADERRPVSLLLRRRAVDRHTDDHAHIARRGIGA